MTKLKKKRTKHDAIRGKASFDFVGTLLVYLGDVPGGR